MRRHHLALLLILPALAHGPASAEAAVALEDIPETVETVQTIQDWAAQMVLVAVEAAAAVPRQVEIMVLAVEVVSDC